MIVRKEPKAALARLDKKNKNKARDSRVYVVYDDIICSDCTVCTIYDGQGLWRMGYRIKPC